MRTSRKIITLILTIALMLTSVMAVYADATIYPTDVINTPLMTSVKFLIDKKVLSGYPDGTFKPNNPITRAEIAVAVAKMTNRINDLDAMANKNVFADLSGYDWAKGHINALVDAGIIKGVNSTTYAPAKNITYAELITILVRTNAGAASELEGYGTWPNNYIQYVQLYNMLGDVSITDWNAPATRGDTAKLIYRFMPKN
jgi:hypothetical protein